MGFMWRVTAPSTCEREKSDGTKYTWADWAKKVFELIVSRHPNADLLVAVNDCYEENVINIKDSEHASRASSFVGGSKNVFPNPTKVFPTAREFNDIFKNKANKRRIQAFLKMQF